MSSIPVFHVGLLETRGTEDGTREFIWPLFFRTIDIDQMWNELNGDNAGTERPPVRVISLAELVLCLREPEWAPAPPYLCAPLDAVQFVNERDRSAVRSSQVGEEDIA